MKTFTIILIVLFNYGHSKDLNGHHGSAEKIDHPDKFFLEKIFAKYGDGGMMTFEGFEHLLHNLGLGGNIFEAPHGLSEHRINGTFSEIHDTHHRHKRHVNYSIDNCFTPKDITEIFGLEVRRGQFITANTFLHVCPALVYQLDIRTCYKDKHSNKDNIETHLTWIYASISVFLISVTGLLGVAVMPVLHSRIFGQLLHFLVSLAIGTLLGDALLHLLPHALMHSHGEGEMNTPIFKLTTLLLTILIFYSIESLLSAFIKNKGSHGHSHGQKSDVFEMDIMLPQPEKKTSQITPVSFMVILGDGLHNITDGMAIGAAFSTDLVTGLATSLAVFCHELPHELGDFAVLLKTGMKLKTALMYNVISSVLSFVGMVAGILLAENHELASEWVYIITAGTFIYIAMADLFPEINKEKKFSEFALASLGILSGYSIMISIALYEDSMKQLFS